MVAGQDVRCCDFILIARLQYDPHWYSTMADLREITDYTCKDLRRVAFNFWVCTSHNPLYFVSPDITMKVIVMSVLLFLLSALVEVHSQTVPYISFMGNNNLPTTAYS